MGWTHFNKPPLGTSLDGSESLSQGLIGLWVMNEGSGNKVFDLSGNGKTATFVNDTHFVAGKHGFAVDFDGTGDYADLGPAFSNISADLPFSIVMLIKFRSFSVGDRDIFYSDTNGSNDRVYMLYQSTAGRLQLDTFNGSTASKGGSFNTLNSWVHVVGTNDGASRNMTFYIDSVLQTSGGYTGGNIGTNARFGLDPAGFKPFDGQIDHAIIYDRALISSEVVQLFINPFIMFDRDPIELWVGSVAAAAAANPKGPLGHPLHGALAGPISF